MRYVITASGKKDERATIVTDGRESALKYVRLFQKKDVWTSIEVSVGNVTLKLNELENLP